MTVSCRIPCSTVTNREPKSGVKPAPFSYIFLSPAGFAGTGMGLIFLLLRDPALIVENVQLDLGAGLTEKLQLLLGHGGEHCGGLIHAGLEAL